MSVYSKGEGPSTTRSTGDSSVALPRSRPPAPSRINVQAVYRCVHPTGVSPYDPTHSPHLQKGRPDTSPVGAMFVSTCMFATLHWTCKSFTGVTKAALPLGLSTLASGMATKGAQKRDGLTPDWLIRAGCRTFGLHEPTPERPYIDGLLDPCTNSKSSPNIPAQKLYDRSDDGLLPDNLWEGFHVILNPPYESQVTWRFVNRAIDEVEAGRVRGVLLILRNSTGTEYFQRLLPYPRVSLRQGEVLFKDYERTPIRFNIVVFCLADDRSMSDSYSSFYREFCQRGEVSIPLDLPFLLSQTFKDLIRRLHAVSLRNLRDNWVQCNHCKRWRELPYAKMEEVLNMPEWHCSHLHEKGCKARLSSKEKGAFQYSPQTVETHRCHGSHVGPAACSKATRCSKEAVQQEASSSCNVLVQPVTQRKTSISTNPVPVAGSSERLSKKRARRAIEKTVSLLKRPQKVHRMPINSRYRTPHTNIRKRST